MHFKANCLRKKELKNGIEIWVSQVVFRVMDQNIQNIILSNNSRTAWPTWILMLFLSSLANVL